MGKAKELITLQYCAVCGKVLELKKNESTRKYNKKIVHAGECFKIYMRAEQKGFHGKQIKLNRKKWH